MINTNGFINESVDKESPFSKYMSEIQQKVSVREQPFEGQHDYLTIATEEHIAEMKEVVDNAMAMKHNNVDRTFLITPPTPQYETN